jgi:hypothetical protein
MLVCYFHTSTPALPLKYAGVPSVFTNSAHSLGAWASPCETASPRQTKHASSGDAPGPTSTDTRIPWGRGHPTCLRAGCVIRCSTVLCFATRAHSLNLCAEPPVSRRHPPIFYASLAPARLSPRATAYPRAYGLHTGCSSAHMSEMRAHAAPASTAATTIPMCKRRCVGRRGHLSDAR